MSTVITAGNATNGLSLSADNVGALEFKTGTGAGTTAVTINSSQNVGIGTTSPSKQLNVYTAANSLQIQSVVRNGNTGTGVAAIGFNVADISEGDYTQAGIGLQRGIVNGSGALCFYNKGSGTASNFTTADERMRIDSNGNLCVGTTSAIQSAVLSALSTTTTASFRTSATAGAGLAIDVSRTSATGDMAYFRTSSTTLAGYITCPTGTTTSYVSVSDYRLKENVQPMVGALDKVAQLKPCTYTWKSDGSDGQGFIAHELQAVVPDCVAGEKDAVNEDGSIKPQGIDTSFLVATLTAAIQELKAELDALKAKVGA